MSEVMKTWPMLLSLCMGAVGAVLDDGALGSHFAYGLAYFVLGWLLGALSRKLERDWPLRRGARRDDSTHESKRG